MARLLGLLALLGFIFSFVVHIMTFFQINIEQYLGIEEHPGFNILLHFSIFVVFIPFVLSARKSFGKGLEFYWGDFPIYMIILGLFLIVYQVINANLAIKTPEGVYPVIEKGRFLISIHGKMIREVTESEYYFFRIQQLRLVSALDMLFYFMPLTFFLFRKKKSPTH